MAATNVLTAPNSAHCAFTRPTHPLWATTPTHRALAHHRCDNLRRSRPRARTTARSHPKHAAAYRRVGDMTATACRPIKAFNAADGSPLLRFPSLESGATCAAGRPFFRPAACGVLGIQPTQYGPLAYRTRFNTDLTPQNPSSATRAIRRDRYDDLFPWCRWGACPALRVVCEDLTTRRTASTIVLLIAIGHNIFFEGIRRTFQAMFPTAPFMRRGVILPSSLMFLIAGRCSDYGVL